MSKQLIDFVQEQMEDFARTMVSDTTKVTRTTDTNGANPTLTMQLPVGDGMEIKMTFSGKGHPYCSTIYKAQGTSFSFDRLGVEDSFYFESLDALPKQFMEQLERVRAAQHRLAKSTKCNLGPVTLFMTQESIDKMLETLKAGKVHVYHPSGFGTGYQFSIRNISNRYDRAKASKELELLVGHKVYVTAFDAD
jgi:hypothetical protein